MKILIAGNEPGGMYRFRIDLIRELLKENSVTVLVPDGEFVEELQREGCDFIDTPIDRRGIDPHKDFKLLKLYRRIIKEVKPDLVITYTIKPNIYCGLVCSHLKIPYAANITGLGTTFQKDNAVKRLVTRLYITALKRAKVVFFENSENKDIFVQEQIVPENLTCVLRGAGVNTKHFSYQEYPKESHTRFLIIGRIMLEKGFEELICSMRRLVTEGYDVSLSVVGFCEEAYEGKLKECQDEGWLVFHGRQQDVRPFIRESHCFVLPSWHEGMANTNLECAAMGRPVITSNIHGCLEAVEDGVTGFLCEKQNADDLYEKMKAFLSLSYKERREMGCKARKRMEDLFDKQKVVQATINRLQKEL